QAEACGAYIMPEGGAGSLTSSAFSVLRFAAAQFFAASWPRWRRYSSALAFAASMASGATRHSVPLGGAPARAVPSLRSALTWESASVIRPSLPLPQVSGFFYVAAVALAPADSLAVAFAVAF